MSYQSAAQNASMNMGSGMLGNAIGGGITSTGTISTNAYQNPFLNKDQHVFECQRVENGWTLAYRSKHYIAPDLDSLMDQIKAAMVMERIEK